MVKKAPYRVDFNRAFLEGEDYFTTAFYEAARGILMRTIYAKINNPTDAENVFQESMIEIHNSAHRFDPSRGSGVTFMIMIARRKTIDFLRRKEAREKRAKEVPLNDGTRYSGDFRASSRGVVRAAPTPTPSVILQHGINREVARKLFEPGRLDYLLSKEQGRFLRDHFGGKTMSQIAKTHGVPLGTVKSSIFRAKEALKDHRLQNSLKNHVDPDLDTLELVA